MSSLHDLVKNRPFIPDGTKCKLVFSYQRIAQLIQLRCLYNTEVVELSGIEPLTPCLQSRCSPS